MDAEDQKHSSDYQELFKEFQAIVAQTKHPTIYGEVCLCFDCDFVVEDIDRILNAAHSESGLYRDMRINPITGVRNPGYWEYHTETVSHFDCDTTMNAIYEFLHPRHEAILSLKKEYDCTLIIRVWVSMECDMDHPAIRIEQPFLGEINALDAIFDIIIDGEWE